MKCGDVRTFMSQIASRSVSTQLQQADVDFLSTNGYISAIRKEDYDRTAADVSTLAQMNANMQAEMVAESVDASKLYRDEKHTHSILFHLEGSEKREAELAAVKAERSTVAKENADIANTDAKIRDLIQKKSQIDRMVPYDGEYVSLTGLGVLTLNGLNVRNYRVSDTDFSDFLEETKETSSELRSIAEKGRFFVTSLKTEYPDSDVTQLWNVSIGLGKLQADPDQLNQRFRAALGVVRHFNSTHENEMMAAEILTAARLDPSQSSTDNSDLQNLSKTLDQIEHDARHHAHVPKQLSAGIAATVLYGRRHDGTYPIDRYVQLSTMTRSFESAAILSIMDDPSNQLPGKFQSFRQLFSNWGYQTSEDTELASAYLAISDLVPGDMYPKMTIIVEALKPYLAYPLVAAAILTSIPTLEANETLDLTEKAFSQIGSLALGLERSELLSLAVRMIHGIKNELVRQLDPTAPIAKTPVQFTHPPSFIFFPYRAPLVIAHSSYYSTFSGMGGVHPAHVHGFGGGGGFGG